MASLVIKVKVKVKDLFIVQISTSVFSGLYLSPWQGKRILLLAAVDPTLDLCTRFPLRLGGPRQCGFKACPTLLHMAGPGIEPVTPRSQVRRLNHYAMYSTQLCCHYSFKYTLSWPTPTLQDLCSAKRVVKHHFNFHFSPFFHSTVGLSYRQ